MLLRIKSLYVLLFFLSAPSFSYMPNFCAILNNSNYEAVMGLDGKKTVIIKPRHTKKIALDIPFNDVKQNLIDFVADRHYAPVNSIILRTHAGTFFIWRDYRGVVIARAFQPGMSRDEARPQVALPLSEAEYSELLGYIITINKIGALSVEKKS